MDFISFRFRRSARVPPGQLQIWMGHAAVTDRNSIILLKNLQEVGYTSSNNGTF